MRAGRENPITPIGLGFRAGRGGSVAVGVAADGREPRVVLSTFLATAAEGDRLSHEPYHVAAEMERGPHGEVPAAAAAAIAEGRKRQGPLAAKGLDDIVRKLRDARYEPVVAALLVNRSGWLTSDLGHSLSWPEHVRIAEGLAVRDALRFAFGRLGLEVAEMDETSLYEVAPKALRRSSADIDRRLQDLGATIGRPWRKEQKLACLSAWVAVAALQRHPSADR
jgi:hypothetical protein